LVRKAGKSLLEDLEDLEIDGRGKKNGFSVQRK